MSDQHDEVDPGRRREPLRVLREDLHLTFEVEEVVDQRLKKLFGFSIQPMQVLDH